MFSKADIWRSALRARDIQLMLRASRLFPRRHDMTGATKDDLMRVEIAKYVLGSGGQVNETRVERLLSEVLTATPAPPRRGASAAAPNEPVFQVVNPLTQGLWQQHRTEMTAAVAEAKSAMASGRIPSFSNLSLERSGRMASKRSMVNVKRSMQSLYGGHDGEEKRG